MRGENRMSTESVVIVGAGHAGSSAANFLRQYGWKGPITLVGDEAGLPYQRPPLSKAWLKGESDAASLILRPKDFYAANAIELRTSTRVASIEREARAVVLDSGERLSYGTLILALGSRLRRLKIPGANLRGVFGLRTTEDADRLKAVIAPGKTLVIVGGGYIGLEVAATARDLGADVVLVESAARVLARSASNELSAFLQAYHRASGIQLELNASVAFLSGRGGQVACVHLADGRSIDCDAVLVGIGADGNDLLAREAKLACDGGIIVDDAARCNDPAIFAIGDCTTRPLPRYGRKLRVESIPSAIEQAKQAASAICRRPAPAPEVPWFWSDQSELRLQIAGLNHDVEHSVLRGEPGNNRFAIFHLSKERKLQAVEAVNAPADYMAGRMLVAGSRPLDLARLADQTIPIKQLLN
jgi:3-phenylpropionate/trans-cinnamate dioxygenase ferredoxin reductase component